MSNEAQQQNAGAETDTAVKGASIILSDECSQHDLLTAYRNASRELAMRKVQTIPSDYSGNVVSRVAPNVYVVSGMDLSKANPETIEGINATQDMQFPFTVAKGTWFQIILDDGNACDDNLATGATIDDLLAIAEDQANRTTKPILAPVGQAIRHVRRLLREA